MLLFGTMSGGLYVLFAFTPITYATLLVAVVLLTTSFLFVASAQNGLASMIGQQHAMSGQISVVWNIFASVPTVGALLIGGALSDLLEDSNADQAGASYIRLRVRVPEGLSERQRRLYEQLRTPSSRRASAKS